MNLATLFPPQTDFMAHRDQVFAHSKANLGIPFLLLAMLGMMMLPIPPFLLDVLFTFNIALSIVVLLVAVYTLRPLDFAVFPTVLLVSTLMRLALNVASTRVVLLEGHHGGDAAGKVIQAFGSVVVGGNFAVGIVVFIILMIINFVVVTKGAGRIAEVSARFTLDAMPGKQMAIDADLNAGLIDQDEARKRRAEVAAEADFYGSMDGASKFVRGDAVAGILILFINIIGGLVIGIGQHHLDFSDALEKYTLLTIGDGLVAQIPSLLLSTSAAMIVTRVNTSSDMREQVMAQLFASPKALAVAGATMGIIGVVPGMPHVSFLLLAILCGGGAFLMQVHRANRDTATEVQKEKTKTTEVLPAEQELVDIGWDDVGLVDQLGLEVGYRLIPLVDKGSIDKSLAKNTNRGELLARIRGIRKKLSRELGFLIPSVHIRDNLDLNPNAYRISLMGVCIAEGDVYPDREMAINPGQVYGNIEGIKTRDPAFGLDAVWIEPVRRDQAQTIGYTVVDASTVIATHLNQVLQQHAWELLGHEEVQKMLDQLAKQSPKLVSELVPTTVSLNVVLKVLQSLLRERIPVADMRSICEAMAAAAGKSKEVGYLTGAVRQSLSRIIVQGIFGNAQELAVITLDPSLEQLLLQSVMQSQKSGGDLTAQGGGLLVDPGMIEKLQQSMRSIAERQSVAGKPAVFLVSSGIRDLLSKVARHISVELYVLAYEEIPSNKQVTVEGTIGN